MISVAASHATCVVIVSVYTVLVELSSGSWFPPPTSERVRKLRSYLRDQLILFTCNPFAAAPSYNFGIKGFRYQLVNLVAHHQEPINELVHDITLPVDGVAHLILFTAFLIRLTDDMVISTALLLGAIALLIYQTTTYAHRWFSYLMTATYAAIGAVILSIFTSAAASTVLAFPIVHYCQLWLLLSAALRAFAHGLDDLPPYFILSSFSWPTSASNLLHESPHIFRPFILYLRSGYWGQSFNFSNACRLVVTMIRLALVGWLAEFQAGFTWRLFPVSCFGQFVRFLRAVSLDAEKEFTAQGEKHSPTLIDYEAEADIVNHEGFMHSPFTKDIFEFEFEWTEMSMATQAVMKAQANHRPSTERRNSAASKRTDEEPPSKTVASVADAHETSSKSQAGTDLQAAEPLKASHNQSTTPNPVPDATLLWAEVIHFLAGLCGAVFQPQAVVDAYSIHYKSGELAAYEFVNVVGAFYAAVTLLLYLMLSNRTLRGQAPLLHCLHKVFSVFYAVLLAYDFAALYQFAQLVHSQRFLTMSVHAIGAVLHSVRCKALSTAN